eukprot:g17001.t1
MLTLLTNLTQFVYNGKSRLPAVLMGIATVMLSVGPLRNMCFAICMQSYKMAGQVDGTIELVLDLSFNPLLTTRLLQYYTTIGTVLLAVATLAHMGWLDEALPSLFGAGRKGEREGGESGEALLEDPVATADCAT